MLDKFYSVVIKKIITESSEVKTFYFDAKLRSKPGQFVMLAIPGVGQKPFSVCYDKGGEFSLTVFRRGLFTTKLFTLQVGDYVNIFGPYGTNFTAKPNIYYIMVAGGYGVIPLYFLTTLVSKMKNVKIDFCLGAKNKTSLLFKEKLQQFSNTKLYTATLDGSSGYCGYVTDILSSLITRKINNNKKTMVMVCGPELMEKKVLDLCNAYQLNCEISVERYIKCGVGICGQCVVDNMGICLCKDGPVVSRKLANKITEFGLYSRDKCGLKHFFNN